MGKAGDLGSFAGSVANFLCDHGKFTKGLPVRSVDDPQH